MESPIDSPRCSFAFAFAMIMFWENRRGGFRKGGFSNNRFVLKPDVAIASEVSILSKSSLAITDFHAKKTDYFQKRPDVHKIVLSMKLRPPPPPRKSVNFEDVLLICTVFLILDPFRGGGGKPNFADKNFMGTQTFSDICKPPSWNPPIRDSQVWEPPDVGLAPTAVWTVPPPSPHCNWRTLPWPQPFPPHLPPPSSPPAPLGSFAMLREGVAQDGVGGGVPKDPTVLKIIRRINSQSPY